MAIFRRKKTPPELAHYEAAASELDAALDVEKVTHAELHEERQSRINAAIQRADADDVVVANTASILRDARERNHLTERWRALLTISGNS